MKIQNELVNKSQSKSLISSQNRASMDSRLKCYKTFGAVKHLSQIKHINPVVLLLLTSSVMSDNGQGKHNMYWSKFICDWEASVVYVLIV